MIFIWLLLFAATGPVIAHAANLQITMLDVGQGLSILCESDGEYMLYDGGGNDRSSYVVAYLKQHGIDRLKYMIVSHYDEDHLAGLVGVLHTTTVDQILSPDYETETNIYSSYLSAAASQGIDATHPAAGDTYSLGSSLFQILGPWSYEVNDNNRSLVIRLEAGDFSAVITGDAETEEETDIVNSGLNIDCDLYVVGHHGSSSSSSEYFLDAMTPSSAFISVGADNTYGHPTEQTLAALESRGIEIYRSDLQGEVTCYVNENTVTYSQAPVTVAVPAGDMQQTELVQNGMFAVDYILNTNTKKFHYPDCTSVMQMKEKNKQEYSGVRDDLILMGYEPCGNCHP